MRGIDLGRVVWGGLLAGLVINVGEIILNVPILGARWTAAMAALGVAESPAAIPFYVVYGFLLGLGAVWTYAAIRPRFGAGPRTAVVAGVLAWFLAYFLFALGNQGTSVFPPSLVWAATAWGLVEVPLATVVGAWAYREGGASPAS